MNGSAASSAEELGRTVAEAILSEITGAKLERPAPSDLLIGSDMAARGLIAEFRV